MNESDNHLLDDQNHVFIFKHTEKKVNEKAQKITLYVILFLNLMPFIFLINPFFELLQNNLSEHDFYSAIKLPLSILFVISFCNLIICIFVYLPFLFLKKYKQQAELWIENDILYYKSGCRWFAKWFNLDYQLDLKSIRSGECNFHLEIALNKKNPLHFAYLFWKDGYQCRKLYIPSWYLKNTVEPKRKKLRLSFGFFTKNTEKNRLLIDKNLSSAPLIQTLSQFNIQLPKFKNNINFFGSSGAFYLMKSPTERKLSTLFFVIFLTAIFLSIWMDDQYYFENFNSVFYWLIGLIAATIIYLAFIKATKEKRAEKNIHKMDKILFILETFSLSSTILKIFQIFNNFYINQCYNILSNRKVSNG